MSQKLRGIYDALDHGNYKNALKLCGAFLQKQPAHALCKALSAVALERCGRPDEAVQVCGEARAASGVDETVLTTLQVVYRRCRQASAVTQMYEVALSKEPDSEEYAVALFAAAVREGDFSKAQQVATKMYRKFSPPKPKYLHWVIVSILLQVQAGAPPKVLDLAAMMLQKAPVDMGPLKAEGPVPFNRGQLYLLILHLTTLRLQGKYSQALDMLEDCKGLVKLPADIAGLRIQLLIEAGQSREAAREAREQVLRSIGCLAAVQQYVRLAFECPAPDDLPRLRVESAGGEAAELPDHGARLRPRGSAVATVALPSLGSFEDVERHSTDDEVWNALLLFRHLQQREAESSNSASSGASRVACLAELEIRRMAFCRNEAALAALGIEADWRRAVADVDFADFLGVLEGYIDRFGTGSSCFFDLKPSLCLLEEGGAKRLLGAAERVAAAVGEKSSPAVVNVARLRRACRRHRGVDSLGALAGEAQELLAEWVAATAGDAGRPSHALEELLVLATMTLVDMDKECCARNQACGRRYLLDAIGLAESAWTAFPRAFHFKVLLVLAYGALGVPSALLKWYRTLEIKNAQHESLSYLAFDALCAVGSHDNVRDMCHNITHFHEDIDKDGDDALSTAFHSGVFHRVPEYIESLEQVSRSALWGRAVVEDILCEMGQAQTWEAVTECLGRQGVLLSAVANKPMSFWVLRNQDRNLLGGLHPLPACTPLGAAGHSSGAWRAGGPVPTTLVQGAYQGTMTSSALVWRIPARADATAVPTPSRSCRRKDELSAVEELLTQGLSRPQARLRLSAALLWALRLLVQKDGPGEEQLKEALGAAREGLAVLEEDDEGSCGAGGTGGAGGADGAGGAAASDVATQLLAEDSPAKRAASCSAASAGFAVIAWRSALAACEAAQTVLQCISGKENWELAEGQLSKLGAIVRGLLEAIRGKPSADGGGGGGGAGEGAFAVGSCGVSWLWALLHDAWAVLIPAVIWCCASIPKAGSGKKVKEGQEALHASRVALRNLLATVQGGLTDLQADLSSALDGDTSSLLPAAEGKAVEAAPEVPALAEIPSFSGFRERAQGELMEAHRKHLNALREALASRQAVLKAQKGFKP